MRKVFLFPTIEEAKPLILSQPKDPIFISGVGMAETAATIQKAIKTKRAQLIILAGIAGAYDRSLQIGEVVEISSERVSELPERYRMEYTNEPLTDLRAVSGNTTTRSGGDSLGSQIENMEGAALFALAAAHGVECCQIRAISNYVGDPFEEWDIETAVQNLTETLTDIFCQPEPKEK